MINYNNKITIKIDSQFSNVVVLAMAMRGVCVLTHFSTDVVNRLELCLVEIVNNVIEHAYNKEEGNDIEIGIQLHKQAIKMSISDWGRKLPLTNIENIQCSSDCLCSGRGLYIVKQVMDEIDYESSDDKNTFIMTKYLTL